MLVANFWFDFKRRKLIESRLDSAEERVLRHFEGDDRALAEQVFRDRRAALTLALKDIRAARGDFRDAMAAETPNLADMTAALDASEDAAARINQAFHGALRDMKRLSGGKGGANRYAYEAPSLPS